MTHIASLHPQSNVVVVGAAGGLGRAFVQLLQTDERSQWVHAAARGGVPATGEKLRHLHLDFDSEESIRAAAHEASRDQPLDLVIVATGLLHRDGEIAPEKALKQLDAASFMEVLRINAAGPALVAKHFLPRMRHGRKCVFAALSARVGSISDNRLGGWASYRASKAALNMLVRTFAIEQARRFPEAVVVSLHPGTVDTTLSRPFSKSVPTEKLFHPEFAATRLLGVIDALTPADTGGFFAWDGAPIEF